MVVERKEPLGIKTKVRSVFAQARWTRLQQSLVGQGWGLPISYIDLVSQAAT